MARKKINPRKGSFVNDQDLNKRLKYDATEREHERKQGIEDVKTLVLKRFIVWAPILLAICFVGFIIYLCALGKIDDVKAMGGAAATWIFGFFSSMVYERSGIKPQGK